MARSMSRRRFIEIAGAGAAAAAVGVGGLEADVASAHVAQSVPAGGSPATTAAQPAAADPQMQRVLNQLMALEPPKFVDLTPFNARQGSPVTLAVQAVLSEDGKPPLEAVGDVSHLIIPGPGGQLLIRIYTPAGAGPFPGVVYFHGGGWVIANLDTYDSSCRALANAAGAVVVSVAYRQAPEFRFPAAHEDSYAATQWVFANAARLNVDPARIAVAGESAGGNLAAAVCMMARDRGGKVPVYQVLVYPIANYAFDTPSYEENANAMPLDRPTMQWFFGYYLRSAADGNSPYLSILRAPSLAGLPPATVITAQIDPLRDEGEAYAQRLREAGIAVRSTRYDGVTHEFFSMAGVLDKGKAAVADAATGLKEAFGTA